MHEIFFTLLINNTMKVIFTMFFSPETVVDSDDESGSSHESDYDPLTTMCVFTQQDRPIFPTPGPQDVCTIIIPPTASTSPTVSKPTSKKKGRRGNHVDKNLGLGN